jgi:Amt family ammonium transporter
MMGTLAVGFLGQPELTLNKKAGLFLGGGFDLLGVQILGVVAVSVFTLGFAFLMFTGLNAIGKLRVNPEADKVGIDNYEHGATVWSDFHAVEELLEKEKNNSKNPQVSP